MIATSLGKQLRLRRVSRGGRFLVLPFDHPIYFGPQPGAEDPARLAALAREHGATAVLATAGALRRCLPEIGALGVIMRIDSTLSQAGGTDTIMHMLHSAEEAAELGADMVVVNVYVGLGEPGVESTLLTKLATVSRECERIGMPLCGEIIPRVPGAASPSSEHLAFVMRIGLEYGCDVVKTVYNGDPKGFRAAVETGHLPVIMAGGPKASDDLAIFTQLKEAMTSGASGAAIGRRVWGSDRPAASLEAVKAIVMDGATVDQAVAIYRRG